MIRATIFIIITEYFIAGIKFLLLGILSFKRLYDFNKGQISKGFLKTNRRLLIQYFIFFIFFLVLPSGIFSMVYGSTIDFYDIQDQSQNGHTFYFYDYLYYAFSISYSLPGGEIQEVVDSHKLLRFFLIVQVLLTKIVEMIVLAFIASEIMGRLILHTNKRERIDLDVSKQLENIKGEKEIDKRNDAE